MRYIPLTQNDKRQMLQTIGVEKVEDLFSTIPASIRHTTSLELPKAKTELELQRFFSALAAKNTGAQSNHFLGGGAYQHFIPYVVDALSSRGEFATAYTPYQPEVSQGTLQAIFEFQSLVANLLGCEVANASMYDGASSLAEAALMALRSQRKKNTLCVSEAIHPDYLRVLNTYLGDMGVSVSFIKVNAEGRTHLDKIDANVAAVLVQSPNVFGVIEDVEALAKVAHEEEALLVTTFTEALAYALLQAPGDLGADVVAGEGQSLGNPVSFGGPHLGLFATHKDHLRQMPGRLVGKTNDEDGKPGYVLTLSTREQHIRRDKATSNICTNHSLCALRATIYMATLGREGLRNVAIENANLAHQVRTEMLTIKNIAAVYQGPIFNEFVLRLPMEAKAFCAKLAGKGIHPGIPLSRWYPKRSHDLLLTVTEMKSQEDIEQLLRETRGAL